MIVIVRVNLWLLNIPQRPDLKRLKSRALPSSVHIRIGKAPSTEPDHSLESELKVMVVGLKTSPNQRGVPLMHLVPVAQVSPS